VTNFAFVGTASLLLAVNFLLAWCSYSLRDFSRSRLEEICRRKQRERRFGQILKQYESVLLATELLQLVVVLAFVTAVCVWLELPVKGVSAEWWAVVGKMALLLPIVYVLWILVPWTLARVAGEQLLYAAWPLLNGVRGLVSPLLWLSREFDVVVHRAFGREPPETGDAAVLTEEIRTVVDEGQREGLFESEAGKMISRVIEFQEADVADIMTPRTAMVCIESDSDLERARQLLLDEGHSRVPVIGKTTDDIVGMLYAKDLLKHLSVNPGEKVSLSDIARQPFYVPETMGIDSLLKTFKKEHVHLAIVLDEYGGVAGLVTMEDILEEIVGEIVDEYDAAVIEEIRILSPGVSEVDARAHIDDVNDKLDIELPADRDFDTVGGFVFSLLGRIPAVGEQFQWEQLRFTVLEADNRKIVRLRIEAEHPTEAQSTTNAEDRA
jgi:CBS domain containing-hemolysin-like protein